MVQGATFDYDGTIGQTFERQFNWFCNWASKNGRSIPFGTAREFLPFYNSHCGKPGGVQNVYDVLGLPCDMNDRTHTHPVWPAYTDFKRQNPVSFYPGMRKAILDIWNLGHLTIDHQRNKRLRLAINTTNTWETIYSDLAREGVIHCFDSFVDEGVLREYHGAGNHNAITKPSKISLALILGLIDSIGELTLHVGDTLNDLSASHKVMRLNPQRPETLITVGAAWGYEGRERLEQGVRLNENTTIHFNYIIDKPEELEAIVKGLMKSV